jgi:hypothetical protein
VRKNGEGFQGSMGTRRRILNRATAFRRARYLHDPISACGRALGMQAGYLQYDVRLREECVVAEVNHELGSKIGIGVALQNPG